MTSFEQLFENFDSKNAEMEFRRIAESLMKGFVLRANRKDYQLAEIEFLFI